MNGTRRVLVCLLCAICGVAGCRPEASSQFASREAKRGESQQAAPAGHPDAGDRRVLTDSQQQALATIRSAGGSVERDADGFPTGIDLASDRVFADDTAVRAALEFPRLQMLRVALSNVSPDTLSRLPTLIRLRELMLQDAPMTDAELSRLLKSTPEMERLTLRRLNQITDTAIEAVTTCPRLRVVALIEMNQLSGAALEMLHKAENLRALDLRNCGKLTGNDYQRLSSLGHLTELKLGGPMINDEVLSIITEHPAINALTIEDAQVSGDCLQRLARSAGFAQRVRSLAFARCFGVNDESLRCLHVFPNLQTLMLKDIMVSGAFLAEAAEQPLPLKTLVVTDAFVTDAALASLPRRCPQLTRLDLRGNLGVTDASLEILRKMPTLKQVQLDRTGVTPVSFKTLSGVPGGG